LYVRIDPTTQASKHSMYENLSTWLADGAVEIPSDPQIRADLLAVRRKLTVSGFTIQLPTTGDGRHADYAPAIALALSRHLSDPPAPVSFLSHEERRERERAAIDAEVARYVQSVWEKNAQQERDQARQEQDLFGVPFGGYGR
jgi:hypothetical protein